MIGQDEQVNHDNHVNPVHSDSSVIGWNKTMHIETLKISATLSRPGSFQSARIAHLSHNPRVAQQTSGC